MRKRLTTLAAAMAAHSIGLIAIVAVLLLSGCSPPEMYLRLRRFAKPGQVLVFEACSIEKEKSKTMLQGKVLDEEHEYLEAVMEAEVNVISITEAGTLKLSHVTISKLSTRNNPTKNLKPLGLDGATISITSWPKLEMVRLDKKPISKHEIKVLKMFFSKIDPDEVTRDELYGRQTPVRVGDQWSPDKNRLSKFITSIVGVEISPENIESSVVVKDKKNILGQECLGVEIKTTATSTKIPEVENGKVIYTFTMDEYLPVDPSSLGGTAESSHKIQMMGDFIVKGKKFTISTETEYIGLGRMLKLKPPAPAKAP